MISTTTTFRSSDDDDRIARMINNSNKRALTPEQEAEADAWLARRKAIVRGAYQRFPGVDSEGERAAYIQSRMNCEPLQQGLLKTSDDAAAKIMRMHRRGVCLAHIARRLGLGVRAVRNVIRRATACSQE